MILIIRNLAQWSNQEALSQSNCKETSNQWPKLTMLKSAGRVLGEARDVCWDITKQSQNYL